VRIEEVPDPAIVNPDDIIVRITTTGLCGSDLHLYTVLAPFLDAGDVLGHEPMGVVEEIGPGVTNLAVVFYETLLEYLLHELGVTRIIIAGQVTEQCILYSALDAYLRHFEVVVARDCVAHSRGSRPRQR
jgi:hypothetical protein